MKKEILKIIPDVNKYYLVDEWEKNNDYDIVLMLEHEIYLYTNWKEEGFHSKQEVSYINSSNIRKVNGLLKRYYNGSEEL